MSGWSILGKREYAQMLEREKAARLRNWSHESWGEPTDVNVTRVARNCLLAQKIIERPDYGPFADVRQLIALRIAPWLKRGAAC